MENDYVGEVIIINNSGDNSYTYYAKNVRILNQTENLFVNPSWNLGVQESKYNYFGLLNDDILLPNDFLGQVFAFIHNNDKCGLVGINSKKSVVEILDDDDLSYPENSKIKFGKLKRLYEEKFFYWGVAIFGKKSNYYCIPNDMKIYSGDNYLLFQNNENKKINYAVYNTTIKHIGSLTSASISFSDIKWNDQRFYSKIDKRYKKYLDSRVKLKYNNKFEEFFSVKRKIVKDVSFKFLTIMGHKFKLSEEDFYKFSFIMPTYNRGFCICNAIDSLLQQTYQNFDLIIADDGSTDNTEEIIKQKYHKEIESKKIIYIKLKHKGCSYARNIGLKNINSTWVAYLDSDNEISPNFLETYCEAIKHNSNHKCFYSQIRKDEQLIGKPFNYMELCDRNYIDLGTFVHHKSLIGRCGKFDTKLKRLIDWDLILKYTKKYPAYFIEEVLISYNNADFERISNSCSYAIAKKQIEKNIKARETSFLKKIFSVRNDGVHKLVSVLGIRMRFKSKKKEMEMKINSIQRNLDILRKQSNLNTEKLSRILEILEPTSLEQEEGEELILN